VQPANPLLEKMCLHYDREPIRSIWRPDLFNIVNNRHYNPVSASAADQHHVGI
jgi:hypothetical protein